MKTPIAVAALSLIFAPIVIAQERAPELPSLGEFHSSLKDASAPAAVSAKPAGQAGKSACSSPDLNLSDVGRGIFGSTYDIKVKKNGNDESVAKLSEDDGAWTIKDNAGNVVAKTVPAKHEWGTKSDVVDCSGKRIGVIQEEYASTGSNFTLEDANGNPYANTGFMDESSFDIRTIDGETVGRIKSHGIFGDHYTVAVTGKSDARVVAIVGAMNTASGLKRASERRRDRDIPEHGGHGRFDNGNYQRGY